MRYLTSMEQAGRQGHLHLRLEVDADGTAELIVEAGLGAFRGASSAWLMPEDLADFGRRLQHTFPITAEAPIELAGGYWAASVLKRAHVRIRVHPIGSAGLVGVHVMLATPLDRGERPESPSTAAFELHTHYEALRSFGQSVEALAGGGVPSATLEVNAAE